MKVLICGVTGQDGAYLAAQVLAAGCEVWGSSRRSGTDADLSGLGALGVRDRVSMVAMDPAESSAVATVLDRLQPDVIINLAGQSSVAASFGQPREAVQGNALAAVNLLEWVRNKSPATRLINAASGDCFGDTGGRPADEGTRFEPRSPYAVGKCALADLTRLYRIGYGLHVSTAYLFSHESPLRPERFVTRKVVNAAARVRAGAQRESLQLGRLDIVRDWGWASEYMDAIWRMVGQTAPEDLIIATGVSMSLQDFVTAVFAEAGLDWREHVVSTDLLHRPLDIGASRANPSRAAELLGWQAQTRGEAVPRRLYRESIS